MSDSRRERFVYLGMPGYGQVTAAAARAFYRASLRSGAVRVRHEYREGSLLAANFNALWCGALNDAHRGQRVDHFAMLHADVEPADGWLDVLLDELDTRGLDVLGAVVPIKDPKGLTSLALARDDGDNWRPHCRLTMSDVFRLPETFTSDDLGRPLLLNTGCWVCRFDESWARQVRFTINDRIVFNTRLDRYEAQVEPEDWYFSRLCHELGLKVGATRKVPLAHAGGARYANTHPWGRESFDREYAAESPVPACDADGFTFPHDAAGWLTPDEGKALWRLARGRRVLEIGSYCGRSTCCLAQSAAHVTCVDPHDGRATPAPRDTRAEFWRNLDRRGLGERVTLWQGTSAERLAGPAGPPAARFGLVFIDGAHDAGSVRADAALSLPLLEPDGLLAFHDYRASPGEHDGRDDPGVREAVHELLAGGGELVSRHGTLAVVRPPAARLKLLEV